MKRATRDAILEDKLGKVNTAGLNIVITVTHRSDITAGT